MQNKSLTRSKLWPIILYEIVEEKKYPVEFHGPMLYIYIKIICSHRKSLETIPLNHCHFLNIYIYVAKLFCKRFIFANIFTFSSTQLSLAKCFPEHCWLSSEGCSEYRTGLSLGKCYPEYCWITAEGCLVPWIWLSQAKCYPEHCWVKV